MNDTASERQDLALAGEICLVTGASRGLGRATALRLARAGARVVGIYRSADDAATSLVEEAGREQRQIEMIRCDVSHRAEVMQTVQDVLARHSRIDGLVNNAGIWRGGRLAELPEADWRAVLETNVFGLFHVTQAVLPGMLAAKKGRIVNVSSAVGITGYPGDCAYASAKSAIIGFTKSLAKEVAKAGVLVNAVAPGTLETDMTTGLGAHASQRLLAQVPAGRRGTVDEVAAVIEFLMTAPSYLTGAIITIDGGMS